jgi:hypothetical protein
MIALRIAALAFLLVPVAMTGSAPAFFTQLEQRARATASTSENKQITVSCPSGKRVVGAGADVTPGNGHVLIDAIRPNASLTRVTARAREDETGTSETWFVAAYAVCAAPPGGLELVAVTSASSSANKSVVAPCPGSKRLLGTGGEIASPNGQVLLDGLLPDAGLTQATVNALEDETGNAGSWTLTAYAICSNPVAGLERVSVSDPLSSPASRIVVAPCPPGKALLSANGTIDSANGQIVLDAMFPDPALTTAGIAAFEDDTGNSGNWTLTAHAICAAAARRLSVTTDRDLTGENGRGSNCGLGEHATGVGAELTGGLADVWLRALELREAGVLGIAAADETGVSHAYEFAVHAICATPFAGGQLVHAESLISSTSTREVTVPCPAGLRVLGAGASAAFGAEVAINMIRPDPSLTFVTAAAAEDATGESASWNVVVDVYCAPPPAGLQRVQRIGAPTSQEFATAAAVCPSGKHLIGTGGEIVGSGGRVGFDDLLPDAALTRTTLVATEDEKGFNKDWRPVAYSICIDR